MAAPGNFTTLAASGSVTLPLGAQVGYLWQCSNAGTGACGWVPLSSIAASGGALTVSNDTNITASLTGTPATSLLASSQINFAWAGTLATTRGGTNFNGSGLTLGDILYASSGTAFSRLAGNNTGSTRKFLVSTASSGVATAPTWDYLTAADLTSTTVNFTAIGFAMTPPSNAYIGTTNRTGVAGANYQISLGGIYTGISSTTSIIDLDISTTHTSTTSTLTTSAGLQITPNTNATSATITSNYGLLIGAGTNAGGTVTNAYGIYNNVQTAAGTLNTGYYQTGTFTKVADRGQILNDTFSPTTTSTLLAEKLMSTTYNPTSGPYTVSAFYNQYINPTITKTSVSIITTTAYYGLSVKPAAISMSGAAHVITDLYNLYSASVSPTLANGATVTRAYSGYFVNPSAGTSSVAVYTDSLLVGGTTVSDVTTAGTIKVGNTSGGIICASAALATTATVGFLYIPSSAGAQSSVPSPITSGTIPIAYDSTNNTMMAYNGAWKTMPFSSSGSTTVTTTGPNSATTSITYRYKVIGGTLCSVYLPDNLTTWGGAAGTSAITFTGSGNPSPTLPSGGTQRFVIQSFQNNTGNTGLVTINNSNVWTFYYTTAMGSFTGNIATTGTTSTVITYFIS